ncbi:Metal-dependent hydrolase, beta-lactamase superfamily II [Alteromonadaceae bacterium Bs31]|nr:Metal-dependent hydrolase, beta-lactamase superfamily II [Alteromonadaceae bacterium Bs31]
MRLLTSLLILLSTWAHADLEMRVIDTGPGLATVTRFDNGEIMVFGTGHWYYDEHVTEQFMSFIGEDTAEVALLVSSVSNPSHIGATDELFSNYLVKKVIRTGYPRDSASWRAHNAAIEEAEHAGLTHDIDLSKVNLAHGVSHAFGDARVTFLSGFHESPPEWGLIGNQYRNATSIVMRIDYQGKSILLTGDSMGREDPGVREKPAADAPAIATERYLIDNSGLRPVAADVLIAPNHGSDLASSTEFIKAVAARWVIFSAGHGNGNPTASTAKRYTALGYQDTCLLRTDIGDHESEKDEWEFGRSRNHVDIEGDNPIQIVLPTKGEIRVNYVGKKPVACERVITPQRRMNTRKKVRKSNSGVCHGFTSTSYKKIKSFKTFDNLESCLASGGRLPN